MSEGQKPPVMDREQVRAWRDRWLLHNKFQEFEELRKARVARGELSAPVDSSDGGRTILDELLGADPEARAILSRIEEYHARTGR